MAELREILSFCLLVPGAVLCLIGAVGILRFPDVYSRMHAAGIIDTLGAALILIGLMLVPAHWTVTVKLLSVLFFLYVTASTATHALAHAAWTSGLDPIVGEDAPSPSEMRQ
jgi:multicomponent Na+:H+ antiporter subunit G